MGRYDCCGTCKNAEDYKDGKSTIKGEDIYCNIYKKKFPYDDYCKYHEDAK